MLRLQSPLGFPINGANLHTKAPRAAIPGELLPGRIWGAVGTGLRRAARSCKAGQVHHLGRLVPMGARTIHVVHLQVTHLNAVSRVEVLEAEEWSEHPLPARQLWQCSMR